MSKKIYLNKSDSIASAIEKVIGAEDDSVVLYIPRDAEAGSTKKNLELLKRESEAAGKDLVVESVDESILSRLDDAGLKSANPFLGRGKKTVSDIVHPKDRRRSPQKKQASEEGEKPSKKRKSRRKTKSSSEEKPRKRKASRRGGGGRRGLIYALVLLILVSLIAGAMVFLPKTTIAITLEKMEHGFIGNLVAGPSIEESRLENDTIYLRGVVLSGEKNLTKEYPATGTDSVGRKATGTITIYNDYNTSPQTLVATTRFTTPDGKIYRIDNQVTVPPAEMVDGELVPSSIKATVTADQPGEEYNIGPVDVFRIPGFQGSDRYNGFYASSDSSMTGGYTGAVNTPTESDIESAREDLTEALKELIKTEFLINLPDGIQILDEGLDVEILSENVDNVVDQAGNFKMTMRGSLSLIGFSSEDLVSTLETYFEGETGLDLSIYDYTTEFGAVELDSEEELVTAAISFDSVWVKPFNKEEFKDQIKGMTQNELRSVIFASGAKSGEVRMWPFWVGKVPQNSNRISIDVD